MGSRSAGRRLGCCCHAKGSAEPRDPSPVKRRLAGGRLDDRRHPSAVPRGYDYGRVERTAVERGRSRGPHRSLADSWIDALKRTVKAFKAHKLGDWAAALTYFGILAIFPALLVVVSVLGLIGAVRHGRADQEPRGRGPRAGAGDRHQRDQEPPGRRERVRHRVRHRPRGRDLGVLGLRQRLHERLELDLRRRGGPRR